MRPGFLNTFLPGLALTLITFGAGWLLLSTGADASMLQWEPVRPGRTWMIAALIVTHELIHGLALWACRVPLADLRLRVRPWGILIDVVQPPPSAVMVLVALGPAVALGLPLTLLVGRTGSTWWLLLLAIHVGSCAWDLRVASSFSRRTTHSAGATAQVQASRARRGTLAMLFLTGVASLCAWTAPERLVATTTRVTPLKDETANAAADSKRFEIAPGPARRMRVTLRTWRDGVAEQEHAAELALDAPRTTLAVEASYAGDDGAARVAVSVDGATVIAEPILVPADVLQQRGVIAASAPRRLRLEKRETLFSLVAGTTAIAALEGAGLHEGKLSGVIGGESSGPFDLLMVVDVKFLP